MWVDAGAQGRGRDRWRAAHRPGLQPAPRGDPGLHGRAAFRARFGRSARAYQIATRWTRRPKEVPLPEHELLEAWRERAAQLGFGEREVEQLLGRTTVREPTAAELQAEWDLLAGPLGLTELSSFTRREVLRGWASQLPTVAR